MPAEPSLISLDQWTARREELIADGLQEPVYGGALARHADASDKRLRQFHFDNSAAALRLWNFLLTEEDRLRVARASGQMLVGAMKDLGTVPVMAYSLPNIVAFYPDGAWWIPCLTEHTDQVIRLAEAAGFGEAFCPVRAMFGAFVAGSRFPLPDLLVCSTGATCDDFASLGDALEHLGHRICWWEIPHRHSRGETLVLPGGNRVSRAAVGFVRGELMRVRAELSSLAGHSLNDEDLTAGINAANRVRRHLRALRDVVFSSDPAPLPALEVLIAEMLAIHFCSEREESDVVLLGLLAEAYERARAGVGPIQNGAARVFWINPVADLRVMNLLEECGGRLCGSDFMFCHALDEIPEDLEPMEALARMALSDPMVGSTEERAARVCAEARRYHAEGLVVSRVPGASHCAYEGSIIRKAVERSLGIPVLEIEVPAVCDAVLPSLATRLEALIEVIRHRRTG